MDSSVGSTTPSTPQVGSLDVENLEPTAVAIASGACYTAFMWLLIHRNVSVRSPGQAVGVSWVTLGFFLVCAVPVHLLLRYGLITPLLPFVVLSRVNIGTRMNSAEPEGLLSGFAIVWLGIVALMLVLGGIEYGVRGVVSRLL